MKSKTMRTFVVDGKEMQFNLTFFNDIFKNEARMTNVGIGELEEQLASTLYVDKSTVHAWRNRVNGPSDIEKVKQIAAFFKLETEDFLIEVENMITVDNDVVREKDIIPFGNREQDAFKRVYIEILHFMNLRLKHDEEMMEEMEKFFQGKIGLEFVPTEDLTEEEYFYLEDVTLEMHIGGVKSDWQDVDFVDELKKVSYILEEEMVDLPEELYIIFEVMINNLEVLNSDNLDIDCEYDSPHYLEEYIEKLYVRNEKIISTAKENFRNLVKTMKTQ